MRANVARFLGFIPVALVATAVVDGCTVVAGTASAPPDSRWDAAAPSGDGGGSNALSADANACQPGDVATWQPGSYHPAGTPSYACSADLIDGPNSFYESCLGPNASTEKCAAFKATANDCYACILTPDTAAHYGPLVQHGGFATANVAGCIELSAELVAPDPSALACAQAVQALSGCDLAACEANCPVTDAVSLASYLACTSAADESGCQTYEAAAACTGALQDGGLGDAGAAVADCFLSSFKDFYDRVVPRFCNAAPPAADAGAGVPPSDAGSTAD